MPQRDSLAILLEMRRLRKDSRIRGGRATVMESEHPFVVT
jgi:hypothetical protein